MNRKIYQPSDLNNNAFIKEMSAKLETVDVIDSELYTQYDVKRGLRNANGTGVLVGLTKISNVEGYTVNEKNEKIAIPGKLYYRGYDVEDIVKGCIEENRFGFEETSYLLLFGELPSKKQLDEFKSLLATKRKLPDGFARDMILVAPSPDLMNKLARSILALYSYDDNPDDISVENVLRQSIELMGYFPALIAYAHTAKHNFFDNESLYLHYPIPELSTAENILRMIRPTGEFTKLEASLLDLSLILHAEHGGGNNSSFTTHVISSSGTDTYAAMAAAVGSLKGPRHGGANIKVINMLEDLKSNVKDITNEKQLEEYFIKLIKGEVNDKTGVIYGLGHAIYTVSDPRAVVLKDMARKLAEYKGLEEDFALCEFIENKVPDIFRNFTGTNSPLPANVDLYSGFVYSALNIPKDIATPLFATARLSGWCAHRLEEIVSGKKLIRPAYMGIQEHRPYVQMFDRGGKVE